jgi:hypothetical protein
MQIRSLSDFWPFYVQQHSRSRTRLLHALGSVGALLMVVLALTISLWFLIAVPLVGYGFAWYAHFFVEKNKPATFGHPFYSLCSDYKMLFLMMAGKMDDEVERCAASLSVVPPAKVEKAPSISHLIA